MRNFLNLSSLPWYQITKISTQDAKKKNNSLTIIQETDMYLDKDPKQACSFFSTEKPVPSIIPIIFTTPYFYSALYNFHTVIISRLTGKPCKLVWVRSPFKNNCPINLCLFHSPAMWYGSDHYWRGQRQFWVTAMSQVGKKFGGI